MILGNWEKIFLENAVIAMELAKAVKEYKLELVAAKEENQMLTKIVGKITVEKEWLEKKLENLSVSQQCDLLNLNRSTFYYTEKVNNKKHEIQQEIAKVFAKTPIYGAKKVHQQLLENGVKASLNTVATYRKELGLKAILAVKQVTTTVANKQHRNTVISLEALIFHMLIRYGAQI